MSDRFIQHKIQKYQEQLRTRHSAAKAIPESQVCPAEEAKYDGFYAVRTNLEEVEENNTQTIRLILQHHQKLPQIQESFQLIKECRTVPMNPVTEDAVNTHFLIYFIALFVLRVMEQLLDFKYAVSELIHTIKDINLTSIKGLGYIPSFTRTALSDDLAALFHMSFSKEFLLDRTIELDIKQCRSPKHSPS